MTADSEETKDRIAAMLRQETTYQCIDYVNQPPEEEEKVAEMVQTPDLMNMLEECALLVTDQHYVEPPTRPCSPMPRNSSLASLPKSPSTVSLRSVVGLAKEEAQSAAAAITTRQRPQDFLYWRQQMFDWACMVVDSFHMNREIVAVAFNNLDRFVPAELSRTDCPPLTREDYQLFSMAALYTAVKILEPYPRKIGLEALVAMSRAFYTEDDIVYTEQDMLKVLEWRVNPPTAVSFSRLFGDLLPVAPSADMQLMCATITELAVSDPFFLSFKASTIGLASLMHAARLTGRPEAQTNALVQELEQVMPESCSEDLQMVYRRLEKLYS